MVGSGSLVFYQLNIWSLVKNEPYSMFVFMEWKTDNDHTVRLIFKNSGNR